MHMGGWQTVHGPGRTVMHARQLACKDTQRSLQPVCSAVWTWSAALQHAKDAQHSRSQSNLCRPWWWHQLCC